MDRRRQGDSDTDSDTDWEMFPSSRWLKNKSKDDLRLPPCRSSKRRPSPRESCERIAPDSEASRPQENVFEHSPLDLKRETIRLLRLLPGRHDQPIRCTISIERFDDDYPRYAAVSYEWGNSPQSRHIYINDARFHIRPNLWGFLHRLHRQHNPQVLWIDAICINQDSIQEKNHQVSIMNQIYSRAACVYVWLGEAAHDSDYLFDMLNHFMDSPHGYQNSQRQMQYGFSNRQEEERFKKAVYALSERSYWTRIWIIQEILLAHGILLFCGNRKFLWFVPGQRFLPFRDRTHSLGSCLSPGAWRLGVIDDLEFTRADAESLHLKTLFQRFGNLGCSVQHDCLYALIGIAKNKADFDVDYAIPVVELFRRVLESWDAVGDWRVAAKVFENLRIDRSECGLQAFSESTFNFHTIRLLACEAFKVNAMSTGPQTKCAFVDRWPVGHDYQFCPAEMNYRLEPGITLYLYGIFGDQRTDNPYLVVSEDPSAGGGLRMVGMAINVSYTMGEVCEPAWGQICEDFRAVCSAITLNFDRGNLRDFPLDISMDLSAYMRMLYLHMDFWKVSTGYRRGHRSWILQKSY